MKNAESKHLIDWCVLPYQQYSSNTSYSRDISLQLNGTIISTFKTTLRNFQRVKNIFFRKFSLSSELKKKVDKQDWKQVEAVAWVILITTAFECFIEGIAFTLTLQDDVAAGCTVLLAMILKLIPQKLGNAVILLNSGLNHFWENILALLAVSSIYTGHLVKPIVNSHFDTILIWGTVFAQEFSVATDSPVSPKMALIG